MQSVPPPLNHLSGAGTLMTFFALWPGDSRVVIRFVIQIAISVCFLSVD